MVILLPIKIYVSLNCMKKKIFFLGTPDIANPSLEAIAQLDAYEVVGVGVFPDRKVGRKQVCTPCAVKTKAVELGLPILEIANKDALVKITKNLDFDLGIVIAFGMIFPKSILGDKRFINVHFSCLPQYRGASPVQSAILNNDKVSGITWQVMVKTLDAGDICLQKEYNIEGKKTSELWHDFALKTAEEFPEFLKEYFNNSLKITTQQENEATFCGKFTKSNGEVDFKTNTAQEIDQKFRAFDVWPEIFVKTKKGDVKIKECFLTSDEKSVEIECKDNTKLYLKTIQISGRKSGSAIDIIKGNSGLFES